jgi:nicotinate dehydrogenase subunit B
VIEAEYEWPYQSHASMAGGCALADVREDRVRFWTGTQKPHYAAEGVASILGVPIETVHGTWVIGPGSYGRNDAGDVTMDAAVLSQAVGRPVRVQYMRNEGTGWDPKGPASVHRVRAALGADGKIGAWEFYSKAFSRADTDTNESQPKDTLAGQLLGFTGERVVNFGAPENAYEFANESVVWETIPTLLEGASPLRTSHLRDPVGPQIQFVSESFMDEIAAAVGADPVEFRLRHLTNERDRAVIEAAAERAGWRPGPTGTRRGESGDVMTGQGIAYARRNGTLVAIVTDVEVNQRTGRVWVRKATVAHDCGQIINPATLKTVVEANIVQGISRSLFEEVNFSRRAVTSIDWVSYPIIGMRDVPEEINVILLDHPESPPLGAGEPSMRMLAASINNAVFEATGVRFRRAPLTPERIRASFS